MASIEAQEQTKERPEDHGHVIHFTVDGEPCETKEKELTPNQIIKRFAGKDPATHYLMQIVHGHEPISYQGKGEDPIRLREGMKFQVMSTGPTPVSDPAVTGVQAFLQGLAALGFEPAVLPEKPDHVTINYEVETGRFAGKRVEHGFVVPADFPLTPPSGPHVSPHIHPVNSGGPHPTGSIQASPFGGEWQYWSRPVPDWAAGKKTVAAYMSHIWRLWDTQ